MMTMTQCFSFVGLAHNPVRPQVSRIKLHRRREALTYLRYSSSSLSKNPCSPKHRCVRLGLNIDNSTHDLEHDLEHGPVVGSETTQSSQNVLSSPTAITIETPLLDAIVTERERVRANFFCPGHKQGTTVHEKLAELLGTALRADLPELPALDNLFAAEGVIAEAQRLASDTFTTKDNQHHNRWKSFFLVNGTTCGVEAALLACVQPGSKVILPRNAHQSAVHALVLCGAVPVWIDPVYDRANDITHGVTVQSVERALKREIVQYHSKVDAVLIISPTYHGVLSDIQSIADVVHQYESLLIVDEAHGAHLSCVNNNRHSDSHRLEALPESATHYDADIVLHSIHKTLPALTQAAMMHIRQTNDSGKGIDEGRIRASLQLVQSTSPSYLLLASLDSARALMQEHGYKLLSNTVKLAQSCADRINSLPGFSVLTKETDNNMIYELDPTRITVFLPPQISGYDVDEHLIDGFGVYAELPSFRHITFVLTVGTTQHDIDLLITSLSVYSATNSINDIPFRNGFHLQFPSSEERTNTMVMTPRDAFFAPSINLSAENAIGHVSAETLCPYPPGCPVILPGEVITSKAVNMLKAVLKAGGSVSGASDETLSTIRVINKEATETEMNNI